MEEPIKRSWTPLAVAGGIVVGILVGGGGAYTYERHAANADQANLRSQITTLQARLAATPVPTSLATPTTTPVVTSTPTPSLQTYTNTFYGFTFKYPASTVAKVIAPTNGQLDPLSSTGDDPDVNIYEDTAANPIFTFVSEGLVTNLSSSSMIASIQASRIKDADALAPAAFTVDTKASFLGTSASKVSFVLNPTESYDCYFVKEKSGETWRFMVQSSNAAANAILSSLALK